jgi:Ca-activated chloride channel family protein
MIKQLMLILAVAGIGVTMARPQWGEQADPGQTLGQDILFALDCSRSMLAADVTPTRLQRAKLAILDFIHRRSSAGRIGLVAFAGQAFLQCPLTYDYAAFEETLNAIDERTIPIPGTDIGGALDEAFRATPKGDQQKILILLTDGEDLEKTGIRTAEALAKKNVVVFTIGVGTPAGAEIRVLNEQGRADVLRDNKGEVVQSRLDEATLRSIAQATRGTYYPLGALGEGLTRVRLALQSLDTGATGPRRKFWVERFHIPLAIVLILLIGESVLGTRRLSEPIAATSARGR